MALADITESSNPHLAWLESTIDPGPSTGAP